MALPVTHAQIRELLGAFNVALWPAATSSGLAAEAQVVRQSGGCLCWEAQ